MSEETIIDNIDLDLSTVDLSYPLLPKQTLRCLTGEVTCVEVQNGDQKVRKLRIPLTLEEPGRDTKGNVVDVGFRVRVELLMTPVGKMTQEQCNRGVAEFIAAMDRTKRAGNLGQPSRFSGKPVLVTFDTRNDKKDLNVQYQDVKRWMAVK